MPSGAQRDFARLAMPLTGCKKSGLASVILRRFLGETSNGPSIDPLVNMQKTMEHEHILNGKTHCFYGHVQWLCEITEGKTDISKR